MRILHWLMMFLGVSGAGWTSSATAGSCADGRTAYHEALELGTWQTDLRESIDLLSACLDRPGQRVHPVSDAEDLLTLADATIRWAQRSREVDAFVEAWNWLETLARIDGLNQEMRGRLLVFRARWHESATPDVYAHLLLRYASRGEVLERLCPSSSLEGKSRTTEACVQGRAGVALNELSHSMSHFKQAGITATGRLFDARFRHARVLSSSGDPKKAMQGYLALHSIVAEHTSGDPLTTPAVIRALMLLESKKECGNYGKGLTPCLRRAESELEKMPANGWANDPGLRTELSDGLLWRLSYYRVDSIDTDASQFQAGLAMLKARLEQLRAFELFEGGERRDLVEKRIDVVALLSTALLFAPTNVNNVNYQQLARNAFALKDERSALEQVRSWLESEQSAFENVELKRSGLLAVALLRLAELDLQTKNETGAKASLARVAQVIARQPDPGAQAFREQITRGSVNIDVAFVMVLAYARSAYFELVARTSPIAADTSRNRLQAAQACQAVSYYRNDTPEHIRTPLARSLWLPTLEQDLNRHHKALCNPS